MKISQNVYRLESTAGAWPWKGRDCYAMVYAVLEEDGITLIDTGFPDKGLEILSECRELGGRMLNIKQILLTHADLDHMGNAAIIQEKTDCPVWIAAEEACYLQGTTPRFGEKQEMAEAAGLKNPQVTFYPESGRLGNLEILPTPGHSRGHVCLLYNKKILFGGDLFSIKEGVMSSANPAYSEDVAEAEISLKRILTCRFSILCPAHGEPEKRIHVTWKGEAV